ncbi:MAG: hypothetical protein ACYCOU_06380 [Sulfobacillus sp.]
MGIYYDLLRAFAFRFKGKRVRQSRLDAFLQENPDYVWCVNGRVIYPRASVTYIYRGSLSYYESNILFGGDPFVDARPFPFIGVKPLKPLKSPPDSRPDVSALVAAFGDDLIEIGWVKIGYTY